MPGGVKGRERPQQRTLSRMGEGGLGREPEPGEGGTPGMSLNRPTLTPEAPPPTLSHSGEGAGAPADRPHHFIWHFGA